MSIVPANTAVFLAVNSKCAQLRVQCLAGGNPAR